MPTMQIRTNRDVLLELNIRKRGNMWRVVGPRSTHTGANRNRVVMTSLVDHLKQYQVFRDAVARQLIDGVL